MSPYLNIKLTIELDSVVAFYLVYSNKACTSACTNVCFHVNNNYVCIVLLRVFPIERVFSLLAVTYYGPVKLYLSAILTID